MVVLAVGNNGSDAVELYQKFKPDIVLMDVRMPIMIGFIGWRTLESVILVQKSYGYRRE